MTLVALIEEYARDTANLGATMLPDPASAPAPVEHTEPLQPYHWPAGHDDHIPLPTMSDNEGERVTIGDGDLPTGSDIDPNYVTAQTAVAGFWSTALTNEETRFNNLNTRGLGVLTIAGLVTGIAGFFVKDIDTKPNPLSWARTPAAILVVATVVLLVVAAGVVIYKVLMPEPRRLFDDQLSDDYPWALLRTSAQVDWKVLPELQGVAKCLRERNKKKATSLVVAYYLTGFSVLTIAAAAVLVALQDAGIR